MRQQGTLSITVVDELMIESLFHSHCVPEYINYGKAINDVTRKMRDSDENKRGDIRNDYSDGSTEIKFVDGHSRYIKGNYILTKFQNGNMEQFLPDGTKIEYFADKGCDIITFKSAFKVLSNKLLRFAGLRMDRLISTIPTDPGRLETLQVTTISS